MSLERLRTLLQKSALDLGQIEAIWGHFSGQAGFHILDLMLPLVLHCPGTLKQKLNLLYQLHSSLDGNRGVSVERLRRFVEALLPGLGESFTWLESQLFGEGDRLLEAALESKDRLLDLSAMGTQNY